MQAWVEKLVELQDIDLKIAKLELQLGELPKRQAEAELQYKAEADALATASDELKQAEVAAKGIETQITTARDKKRDFQAKTITIKNNDEYRAAILQIEMMDKAIADLEEKQIEAPTPSPAQPPPISPVSLSVCPTPKTLRITSVPSTRAPAGKSAPSPQAKPENIPSSTDRPDIMDTCAKYLTATL